MNEILRYKDYLKLKNKVDESIFGFDVKDILGGVKKLGLNFLATTITRLASGQLINAMNNIFAEHYGREITIPIPELLKLSKIDNIEKEKSTNKKEDEIEKISKRLKELGESGKISSKKVKDEVKGLKLKLEKLLTDEDKKDLNLDLSNLLSSGYTKNKKEYICHNFLDITPIKGTKYEKVLIDLFKDIDQDIKSLIYEEAYSQDKQGYIKNVYLKHLLPYKFFNNKLIFLNPDKTHVYVYPGQTGDLSYYEGYYASLGDSENLEMNNGNVNKVERVYSYNRFFYKDGDKLTFLGDTEDSYYLNPKLVLYNFKVIFESLRDLDLLNNDKKGESKVNYGTNLKHFDFRGTFGISTVGDKEGKLKTGNNKDEEEKSKLSKRTNYDNQSKKEDIVTYNKIKPKLEQIINRFNYSYNNLLNEIKRDNEISEKPEVKILNDSNIVFDLIKSDGSVKYNIKNPYRSLLDHLVFPDLGDFIYKYWNKISNVSEENRKIVFSMVFQSSDKNKDNQDEEDNREVLKVTMNIRYLYPFLKMVFDLKITDITKLVNKSKKKVEFENLHSYRNGKGFIGKKGGGFKINSRSSAYEKKMYTLMNKDMMGFHTLK